MRQILDVGERIDQELLVEQPNGKFEVEDRESWSREGVHYCNKRQYLLVPKMQIALKMARAKKCKKSAEKWCCALLCTMFAAFEVVKKDRCGGIIISGSRLVGVAVLQCP